jgi:hypothetical protein
MTDSAKLLMLVTVEWMDGQTQELPSTFHPIRMCVYDVKKIDDGSPNKISAASYICLVRL